MAKKREIQDFVFIGNIHHSMMKLKTGNFERRLTCQTALNEIR